MVKRKETTAQSLQKILMYFFFKFSSRPDQLLEFYPHTLPEPESHCPSAIPIPILDKIAALFDSLSQSLGVGAWCELVDQDFTPGSSVWASHHLVFWRDEMGENHPSNEQVFIAHLAFLVQSVIPEEGKKACRYEKEQSFIFFHFISHETELLSNFRSRVGSLAKEFSKEGELNLRDKKLEVIVAEAGECFVPWMRSAYAKHMMTARWDETVRSVDAMLALTELKVETVPYIQTIFR